MQKLQAVLASGLAILIGLYIIFALSIPDTFAQVLGYVFLFGGAVIGYVVIFGGRHYER